MTNLLLIDEFDKARHRKHLIQEDRCYYYFTYNGRSELIPDSPRSMIKNLKRSPSELKNNNLYVHFKNNEMEKISNIICSTLVEQPEFLDYLWVPIAPSKEKKDPEYDDRLIRILLSIQKKLTQFKFLEIISIKNSTDPSHQTNSRNINEKINNLIIDEQKISSIYNTPIILFDDMITTGATFAAYKQFLSKYNISKVEGLFICKAVNEQQGLLT